MVSRAITEEPDRKVSYLEDVDFMREGMLWRNVQGAILAHHKEPDLMGARVLYAAVAAHNLKGQPVWPMFENPGPQFVELEGRLVRYREEDIADWLRLQTAGGVQ